MPIGETGEIVACALRPEGSLVHLATLVAFVLLAWRVAPAMPRRPTRQRPSPASASRTATSARSMRSPSRSAWTSWVRT